MEKGEQVLHFELRYFQKRIILLAKQKQNKNRLPDKTTIDLSIKLSIISTFD